jgi:hypothetical protein
LEIGTILEGARDVHAAHEKASAFAPSDLFAAFERNYLDQLDSVKGSGILTTPGKS